MLVLSRKAGQKLIIDNQIEVVVLEARGDSVKLGIIAPKHVSVFREELYEEIKKANQQASSETRNMQADDLTQALNWLESHPNPKKTPAS